MGFQVEEYSLSELSRIGLPGRVTPALFWALPIGEWNMRALEDCWETFTQGSGFSHICKDFGLFLAKSRRDSRAPRPGNEIRLDSKGANLADLLPHLIDPPDLIRAKSKVLVLSGVYPQPGWAVCIGLLPRSESVASDLEELMRTAIQELCNRSGDGDRLQLLSDVQIKYRKYLHVFDSEPARDSQTFPGDIQLLKELTNRVAMLYSRLSDRNGGLEDAFKWFWGVWKEAHARFFHASPGNIEGSLRPAGVIKGTERLRLQIASRFADGEGFEEPAVQRPLSKLDEAERNAIRSDPQGWANAQLMGAKAALEH